MWFQKNGDRIYNVGQNLKVIPSKALKAIRAWGTFPFKGKAINDEKIVRALIVVLHYKQVNDDEKKID